MGAVTFPDASVQQALAEFHCFKVDQLARHPEYRDVCGTQRVTWAPAFIFRDAKGLELRRWVGWLPPQAFRAELRFVQATEAHRRGDFASSSSGFEQARQLGAGTGVEPEALYWKGTADFLAGGKDMDALAEAWRDLAKRFPETHWGVHASVIADIG